MILGLHHLAISTPDIERALAFYCDLLEGELVRRGAIATSMSGVKERLGLDACDTKTAMVRIGAVYIEFFEFSNPPPPARDKERPVHHHGYTHICLVTENCQDAYERLSSRGVRFHAPPLKMPTGSSFTYGRDPDGNVFEIMDLPAGSAFPPLLSGPPAHQ